MASYIADLFYSSSAENSQSEDCRRLYPSHSFLAYKGHWTVTDHDVKKEENIKNDLTKRQIVPTRPNSQGVLDEADHWTVNINKCSLPDCCLLDSEDSIDSWHYQARLPRQSVRKSM